MKKGIFAAFVALVIFASFVDAGEIPRVAIIHPKQVKVLIHPEQCRNVELPVIPNGGVIYLQVYTSNNTDVLYVEYNGIPVPGYDPRYGPERYERIPITIYDDDQGKVAYIGVAAENEYGTNTVYAAFIPVKYNEGYFSPGRGCSTMY